MDVCLCLRLCVSYVYTAQYDGFLRKWCRHFECVCVCVCMCVFFCGWLSWHIAPCLPAHLMRGNSFPVILRHFVTYSSMHKQEPLPIRMNRQEMVSTFLHLRASSFTQHLKKVISLAAVFIFWRFFFCNCLVFSLSSALGFLLITLRIFHNLLRLTYDIYWKRVLYLLCFCLFCFSFCLFKLL